jgi:hypothetical protein
MPQVAEPVPSKCEVLNSNPSTAKAKKVLSFMRFVRFSPILANSKQIILNHAFIIILQPTSSVEFVFYAHICAKDLYELTCLIFSIIL